MAHTPTILVTGGAGFIGSHLVECLIQRGYRPIVLDNLSTGHADNLPSLVDLVEGSVTDTNLVQGLVDKVDGIFHLAAISSVQKSLESAAFTEAINRGGTLTVLDAIANSRRGQKQSLVFTSSAAVYGDCEVQPIEENAPKEPLSKYGADKLASEKLIEKAAVAHSIPSTIMRPFNVFGERQDPTSTYSGVVSIFKNRIPAKKEITIFGDGSQSRDFVYVEDVVDCLFRAYQAAKVQTPKYNICSGQAVTILELAQLIASLSGAPLKISNLPRKQGDILYSTGSPKQALAELGFKAEIDLKSGLKKLLKTSS